MRLSASFLCATVVLVFNLVNLIRCDEYHAFFKDEPQGRNKRHIRNSNDIEKTADYWVKSAQHKLRQHLTKDLNYNIAKNVIMFLGDGMSLPTLMAARTYLGQLQGDTGEEARLFFEDFPHTGLSKTYCVDKQVPDSACTATAYLCGIKGNYGTIGVNANVPNNNCTASNDVKNHVESIAAWAQKAGKATGIVTTSRITHASPTGAYGHVANREWESDADVLLYNNDPTNCQDIASQLVFNEPGKNFNVIFGGGRKKFLPKTFKFLNGESGQRNDGVNLIKEWLQSKKGSNAKFIYDKKGLLELDYNRTDYVMGLFESNHMKFHLDANHNIQPTLGEMTVSAIKMLRKEKRGFFLFVEGARIDHGHHETRAHKALDETVQLADAVRLATELTSRQDTLIVVTSDHSHTLTISGYSNRGQNILGLNTKTSDVDKHSYMTLSYANGPGFKPPTANIRYNPANDTFSKNYVYPALVPLKSETHGGDDVGVFALGPWAHLFSGVYEQNVIPHLMAYASCIGNGLTACWLPTPPNSQKVDQHSVKIFH